MTYNTQPASAAGQRAGMQMLTCHRFRAHLAEGASFRLVDLCRVESWFG